MRRMSGPLLRGPHYPLACPFECVCPEYPLTHLCLAGSSLYPARFCWCQPITQVVRIHGSQSWFAVMVRSRGPPPDQFKRDDGCGCTCLDFCKSDGTGERRNIFLYHISFMVIGSNFQTAATCEHDDVHLITACDYSFCMIPN